MKGFIVRCIARLLHALTKLRYRVKFIGLEHLDPSKQPKKGGVLFLPNHPTILIDPFLASIPIVKKFHTRPLVTEYMYFKPMFLWFMKLVDALPIPDMEKSTNSVKTKRNEESFQNAIEGLRSGVSLLVYPSGGTKQTGLEVIGGRSGVYKILESAPEANVILVKTWGLWGSVFSRAILGKPPETSDVLLFSLKKILKSLIFFLPRRDVTVEFLPAPADFPWKADKQELNRYLERWYNTPPGETPSPDNYQAEPLKLVSYSMWGEDFLQIQSQEKEERLIDTSKVSDDIKKTVYAELARMSSTPVDTIKPELSLATDLALDSLDAAELVAFLEERFQISNVSPGQLTTVGSILGIASGQITGAATEHIKHGKDASWNREEKRPPITVPDGDNIPEVFFKKCDTHARLLACVDARTPSMTYRQVKMRVLLLAEKIRHMPGKNIGILLPSSVAANIVVLACLTAGKVPVMINWTLGPRHLQTVLELSGIQQTLTSWGFIDRLENADLTGIDDQLVMLEELRLQISTWDKIKAAAMSYMSASTLAKVWHLDAINKDDPAVLLFTSGTEKAPKGVPLSHQNILCNIRSALPCIAIQPNDTIFSFLPPFHSFGFTLVGLLPLLSGVKIAHSANPTDSVRLAIEADKWEVTLIGGAPTFLKGLLKAAKPEQLKSIRLFFSGAEKAPPELLEQLHQTVPGAIFLEGYGITECSPLLAVNLPNEKRTGVGKAVPGVELCIVNPETHEVLPNGTQGLILARGSNVFSGYVAQEKLASPFLTVAGKEWYSTGDLGQIDAKGNLTIGGRLKRFVKIGGEMVSLTAIETALLESAPSKGWSISDDSPSLAICAKERDGGKTELYLFSRFAASTEDINKTLRQAGFSNIVRVSAVKNMENIPILGTGKINYRALEASL